MILLQRLVVLTLLALFCHVALLVLFSHHVHGVAVVSSVTGSADPVAGGDYDVNDDSTIDAAAAAAASSLVINSHVDTTKKYDLSLDHVKNKVWDVILVTDSYGIGAMATEEDGLLLLALEQLGRKATRRSIEDDKFDDWDAAKLIVLRSAWAKFDYLEKYKRFLETVESHSFFFNPSKLVLWGLNKVIYLRQLAKFVKVPQTIIIYHDEDEDEPPPPYSELTELLNCTDIIIKPTEGNGGVGVKLINETNLDLYDEKMRLYMRELGQDMLVQCFMYSVTHYGPGEINVYLINGQVTHAGYSVPAKGGYLIHEEYGGDGDDLVPSEAEKEFALNVYNAAVGIVGVKPLYMRVDMMYDNDGDLTLMEIACGTTDMNFRDFPASAKVMARAMDEFLREKEREYELIHGEIPRLITRDAFRNLSYPYDMFGTPQRDGAYGKQNPLVRYNVERCITNCPINTTVICI
mmetsp:Transcript_17952/g.39847  ORF Transcript_17952/g.39847 Transcript_17952/m.39847 type:complete len:463 (+) Transcript_17952:158-1546(+)